MLPNYDAGAVARIMGIGFVRSTTHERSATGERTEKARGPANDVRDPTIVGGTAILAVGLPRGDRMEDGRSDHRPAARAAKAPVAVPSPSDIERAVGTGLPREALRRVAEWLAGDDEAKIARYEWSVVPKTTLDRRVSQLTPEESERTERVARLAVHARRALGTDAEAREFMTTRHPRLDGRTPLDAARTDLGTRRVEAILNALEYGLAL